MKLKNNIAGFTLLELLIVIAIIGIISAIVLTVLGDSRKNARNAAVVAQMDEYQKAIELYYSDAGEYPRTNVARTARFCIGEGLTLGDDCMGSVSSTYNPATSAIPEAAFLTYMSTLPRFAQPLGSLSYSSPVYSGCTGTAMANTSCTETDYSIWFLLEGTDQSCGRAGVANASLGGEYTLCRLMPGE